MAERCGRRETFFSPAKVSFESRGRVTTWTPGIERLDEGAHGARADQHRLLAARAG